MRNLGVMARTLSGAGVGHTEASCGVEHTRVKRLEPLKPDQMLWSKHKVSTLTIWANLEHVGS